MAIQSAPEIQSGGTQATWCSASNTNFLRECDHRVVLRKVEEKKVDLLFFFILTFLDTYMDMIYEFSISSKRSKKPFQFPTRWSTRCQSSQQQRPKHTTRNNKYQKAAERKAAEKEAARKAAEEEAARLKAAEEERLRKEVEAEVARKAVLIVLHSIYINSK